MSPKLKSWIFRASVRALKTWAQTMLGFVAVGFALDEINWGYALSVSVVALIFSLLTSIVGLPEVDYDNAVRVVKDINEQMKELQEEKEENDISQD